MFSSKEPWVEHQPGKGATPRGSRKTKVFMLVAALLLAWWVLAYVVAPSAWRTYAQHDRAFDDNPRITETNDHHPGDPLNVALIGTEADLQRIMKLAQWYPAAALGLESDLRIAADSVLSRPDDAAPVSDLYLFGRKEDWAFEQPVGDSPRHRHHVRFWKTDQLSADGRPRWIGSAIYDERVGLSRTTGQITHVTAVDVDTERDYLFQCLTSSEGLAERFVVPGFHQQLKGRNGGGDPWTTDGELFVGVITPTIP